MESIALWKDVQTIAMGTDSVKSIMLMSGSVCARTVGLVQDVTFIWSKIVLTEKTMMEVREREKAPQKHRSF